MLCVGLRVCFFYNGVSNIQNAEQLAKTGQMRSASERQKEGDELLQMRKVEEAKKQQQRANMSPWLVTLFISMSASCIGLTSGSS